MPKKNYSLSPLPFGYKDLEPYLSAEQLKIHYEKHHNAYALGANAILEKINKARKNDEDFDSKEILKSLSFNIGGYILHSLFWKNLAPIKKGGGKLRGQIEAAIKKEFGSIDRFRKEFIQAAMSVEGSSWAALACSEEGGLLITQIEKHNVNIYPQYSIILVIDVFEHAYYIDYKNERGKYLEAIWNIINWQEANKRLKKFDL